MDIMDEKMEKMVEEAKKLIDPEQSAAKTPNHSKPPTLPPLASTRFKNSYSGNVENYSIPRRVIHPAPNPDLSMSTQRNSYTQIPREETEPAMVDSKPDYYSLSSHMLRADKRSKATAIINRGDMSNQPAVPSRCPHSMGTILHKQIE